MLLTICKGPQAGCLRRISMRTEGQPTSSKLLMCRIWQSDRIGRCLAGALSELIVQNHTLSSDLCTRIRPSYSIKPSLRNRFMKKLTRERVVPIITASVS